MCPGASTDGFDGHRLAQTLQTLGALTQAARVTVALSGGADSAALLGALVECCARQSQWSVRALHIHHGLSGSDALADAAAQIARVLGVTLKVARVQMSSAPGLSVEAEARRVRYDAFRAAVSPGEVLLTAHHQEDQAETLLLQLLRGAGVTGLSAMPAVAMLGHGQLWRPLLAVPAAQLTAYADLRGLPYVSDPMNADLRFDRAYLRRVLWPTLTARWPQAARTLGRSATHLASAQRLLDESSVAQLEGLQRAGVLQVAALQRLSAERRAEVLRYWLRAKGLALPPTASLLAIERGVLGARPDGTPRVVWPGVEVRRFAGGLYASAPLADLPWTTAVPLVPGRLDLGSLGALEIGVRAGVGLEAGRFTLRRRQGGERLAVTPTGATRPVKDWLREAGIPPWARARAVLCYDRDTLLGVITPRVAWWAVSAQPVIEETGLCIAWLDPPAVLFGVSFIEPERAFR
jgi:tRNA(Ile)-lysidine synthase